jgi:hypothetical protein
MDFAQYSPYIESRQPNDGMLAKISRNVQASCMCIRMPM